MAKGSEVIGECVEGIEIEIGRRVKARFVMRFEFWL